MQGTSSRRAPPTSGTGPWPSPASVASTVTCMPARLIARASCAVRSAVPPPLTGSIRALTLRTRILLPDPARVFLQSGGERPRHGEASARELGRAVASLRIDVASAGGSQCDSQHARRHRERRQRVWFRAEAFGEERLHG